MITRNLDYEKYLSNWIDSLDTEIKYWDYVMRTKGGVYFTSFDNMTQPNRKFVYEKYFASIPNGKFIDIGSGPFSTVGFVTNNTVVDVKFVDPLGNIYNFLKQRYGFENGIKIETGFVECLDKRFRPNTFDMVHMNNALDHCFDPIHGIYELIYITKLGGSIKLRHAENEAQCNNYSGLHQWNIEEKAGKIYIWNNEYSFDLFKIFCPYVNFGITTERKNNRKYITITMTKKKEVVIPENNYYDVMLMFFYEKLTNAFLKKVDDALISNKDTEQSTVLEELRLAFVEKKAAFKEFLHRHGSIVIFGMGGLGIAFQNVCSEFGINVVETLDKRVVNNPIIATRHPDEYKWDGSSLIVLTMMGNWKAPYEQMTSKTKNKNMVIHIKDLLRSI